MTLEGRLWRPWNIPMDCGRSRPFPSGYFDINANMGHLGHLNKQSVLLLVSMGDNQNRHTQCKWKTDNYRGNFLNHHKLWVASPQSSLRCTLKRLRQARHKLKVSGWCLFYLMGVWLIYKDPSVVCDSCMQQVITQHYFHKSPSGQLELETRWLNSLYSS